MDPKEVAPLLYNSYITKQRVAKSKSKPAFEGAFIISMNDTIYVAGGYVNGVLSNQVWKLEF